MKMKKEFGDVIIKECTDLGFDAINNPGKYKALIGISVRNKFFKTKVMEAYLLWAQKQFSELVILLIDDPDRHNIMVFKNKSEQEALKHARIIGSERRFSYERLCRKLGITNVQVVQFVDFENDNYYRQLVDSINECASTNKIFYQDLRLLMEQVIGSHIISYFNNNDIPESKRESIKVRLQNYITEEIAPLLYFTEKGYKIELDPSHEFLVKKKIYEGGYPTLSRQLGLSKRGHLFATIRNEEY